MKTVIRLSLKFILVILSILSTGVSQKPSQNETELHTDELQNKTTVPTPIHSHSHAENSLRQDEITSTITFQDSTDINISQTEASSDNPENSPNSEMPQNADPEMSTDRKVEKMVRASLRGWGLTRSGVKAGFSDAILSEFRNLSRADGLNGTPPASLVRTDLRLMTWREWKDFCEALQRISADKPDPNRQETWYDVFAGYYRSSEAPSARNSTGFIAWHAFYIKTFENALRQVNPNVRLPVWDPRPDTQIPNHCDSALFTADLLGNAHGQVTVGPFKNRHVYSNSCQGSKFGALLTRQCYDFSGDYTLTTYELFQTIRNNFVRYSSFVRPFSQSIEDMTSELQVGIGGHLTILNCAANDPLLFMLQAFIQAIFDVTMDYRYTYDQQVQLEYPSSPMMSQNDMGDTQALPFDITLRQSLRDAMVSNLSYNLLPFSCDTDGDCNPTSSDINAYWCKNWTGIGQCASKIRIGGVCEDKFNGDVYPHKACFRESFCSDEPTCTFGLCVCTDSNGELVSTPSAP